MKKVISICFIISLAYFFTTGCKTINDYTGLNTGDIAYDTYKSSKNSDNNKSSDSDSKNTKNSKKSKNDEWGYGDSDNSDDHYIQEDDYFIAEEDLGKKQWIYVYVAKMVTPATKDTKNEAKFMVVKSSDEMWTKVYWKTRIATKADIKIGAVIIGFDGTNDDGVNQPPQDKDQARQWNWFMTKITDTSDLHKGYVTTAGGTKLSLNAIRIAVKAK